jgi:hypothetical protein
MICQSIKDSDSVLLFLLFNIIILALNSYFDFFLTFFLPSVSHAMFGSYITRYFHVSQDTLYAETNCCNNHKLRLLLHNIRSR